MPPSKVVGGTAASRLVLRNLRAGLSEKSNHRHEKSRVNIINPALCDDVLRRLQPSLPFSQPVDIIDINPGSCLWSKKVHDALRPRRHVLVEPDRNFYSRYIDPLLEDEGSRYQHVRTLSDLFSKHATEILPEQSPAASKPTPRFTVNDTLLIIANFTSLGAIGNKSQDPGVAIYQYIASMIDPRGTFHHYGLVRMLAWIMEPKKVGLVPRHICERSGLAVRLELGTHTTEVAGGNIVGRVKQRRRQYKLALESHHRAQQRAEEAGLWNPKNREPPSIRPAWEELGVQPDSLGQLRELPAKSPWQERLITLYDEWKQGSAKAQAPSVKPPADLRILLSYFRTRCKANDKAQDWARQQNEIDKAHASARTESVELPALSTQRDATSEKAAELAGEIEKARRGLTSTTRQYVDDRRGFEQDPPLLHWDRRPAEPLLVNKNEFYPAKELALLDIRPAPDLIEKLDDFDKEVCFDYLCQVLFRRSTQPVPDLLPSAVQAGFDDFVQRVPDLFDVSKGGYPNLKDLRPRCMPATLFLQLALVLERWPFRIPIYQMIVNNRRRKRAILYD